MDWFYASSGEQRGPISEAQLDELIRSGTVNQDTLVWSNGMPDWQPLRLARASHPAPPDVPLPPSTAGSTAVCAECGRSFARDDVVLLNRVWVCAQCKPVFLQRLMEGSAPEATGLVWRMDRQFVTRSETPMPDRCVRCNAPANGYRLKRNLYWHAPAYYLLLLVGLLFCAAVLIYVIVAVFVRKRARLYVGLCEKHRAQRVRFLIAVWVTMLAGVGLIFAGEYRSIGLLAILGCALVLLAIVFAVIKVRVIAVKKIDNEFVWVKGAHESFLAELPEWFGPR